MYKDGLKQILNDKIQDEGYLSVDDVNEICDLNGRKRSNGERRLRPSESPLIVAVRGSRGVIQGYKWVGLPEPVTDLIFNQQKLI